MIRNLVIEALEEIRGFEGVTPVIRINEILQRLAEHDVLADNELLSRYANLYRLTFYVGDINEPVEVGHVQYTMEPHAKEMEICEVRIYEEE